MHCSFYSYARYRFQVAYLFIVQRMTAIPREKRVLNGSGSHFIGIRRCQRYAFEPPWMTAEGKVKRRSRRRSSSSSGGGGEARERPAHAESFNRSLKSAKERGDAAAESAADAADLSAMGNCRKCTNPPILDASHGGESISPSCARTRYLHDLKRRDAC